MWLTEDIKAKWEPVVDHKDLPAIKSHERKAVTLRLLENQQKYLAEITNQTAGGSSPLANWDPIMISLVRRTVPNMLAYDLAGVQPMTGPVGLIFAMRARYSTPTGTEAFVNAADTTHSGTGTESFGADPWTKFYDGTVTFGAAMTTNTGENLGGSGTNDVEWNEMAFSIEKTSVEAKTRALKAEYTMELSQDLRAIHGLDAETELANILSSEILLEINREIIYTIRKVAKVSAAAPTYASGSVVVDSNGEAVLGTAGVWDIDDNSDGRYSIEKYKSLLVKINKEANIIARETRRGRGNYLIVSPDVAGILDLIGKLDYAPAINSDLNWDPNSNGFAGVLQGRYKVYVDQYLDYDEIIVGYKGSTPYDAGIFYCPYVPLQMSRALDDHTFQPKIAFKTRYAITGNTWFGTNPLTANSNPYFRKFRVTNL